MIAIKVCMKVTKEPLKRTPVVLRMDADGSESEPVLTDRSGVARFERPAATGKVLVGGIERYHGRLAGEITVDLWSITQSGDESSGTPGDAAWGSTAYPGMAIDRLVVEDREVLTDGEGYLVDPGDWSEGFARAQARKEGLRLGEEHWELIRFLRAHGERHGTQATVREMVRHFRRIWGPDRGNNRYLHDLFPRGGPQKQGNRLAGLLRTKGEH